MGAVRIPEDFDDRQLHIDAEKEEYHPYEYQTENNDSWAGALPVKQYVPRPSHRLFLVKRLLTLVGDCTTHPSRKMLAVSGLPGKHLDVSTRKNRHTNKSKPYQGQA
jgi:hypothetical protein